MKNNPLAPHTMAESSVTSAARADVLPDEVVANQDHFLAAEPKTDRCHFIYRNISTGPPGSPFHSTDQIEDGLEAASKEPRRAVPTNEATDLPRRMGGWQFRPALYWLAALFVIAGAVPAAGQSDSQPGSKLVGAGAVGPAEQGWSVALSADGITAIVGGVVDNKLIGAAWVFTRSGDIWTQQGSKLVGSDAVGQAGQGFSVALSTDPRCAC
jgi:hypothetical protein